MLCRGKTIFLNGDGYTVGATVRRSLEKLADRLRLPTARDLDDEALALCYQWYLYGYIEIVSQPAGTRA